MVVFLTLNICRKLRILMISSSQWNRCLVSTFELFEEKECTLVKSLIFAGYTKNMNCAFLLMFKIFSVLQGLDLTLIYQDLLANSADYLVLVKFNFYFCYWYHMLLLRLYLSELICISFSFTDDAIFIEVFDGFLLNFSSKNS